MSCVSPGIRYLLGDVGDVLADVGAHARDGVLALLVGRRAAQRRHRFERKLGVDHQRPGVGHEDRAVRPLAVRERVLEFIGALRQHVGDDRLQLALAERAARLLVRQHVLQRVTWAASSVMFFCALSITASRACSCCKWSVVFLVVVCHRLAEVLAHRVEPRVDRLLQLAVRALQPAAHVVEPGIELR